MMRGAVLVLALVTAACSGGGAVAPAPFAPDPFADDPVAVLAGLEDRLTGARKVELEARSRASGVLVADLRGTLSIERELRASVAVAGTFVDNAIDTTWRSEAPVSPDRRDTQSPVWADGLLIGFTRMGVMHNWAMVVSGADPEIGNGDIRTWVEADQVAWKDGDPATRTLTFVIVVGGQPSGETVLQLGPDGLPVHRDVTVHFPEGDMHVVEDYPRLTL